MGEGERNCQVSCAFLLHSNLHLELRELLVATIAASNVLQSSACLSQGPRRSGGCWRGGHRVPQEVPLKVNTHTGTHIRLLYGHARYCLSNVTTHPSITKEKYKISTTLPLHSPPFNYIRTEPYSLSFLSFIYICIYIHNNMPFKAVEKKGVVGAGWSLCRESLVSSFPSFSATVYLQKWMILMRETWFKGMLNKV